MSPLMFNINWRHTCHECQNPLDVYMSVYDKKISKFFRDFETWCYLKPFSLIPNTWMYKFYGRVVKRVCLSCYHHPKRFDTVRRECGLKRVLPVIVKSKTSEEIYEYFNDFLNFRKREDLELCIVDEDKRSMILDLEIYIIVR